jgi:hypothetical protein
MLFNEAKYNMRDFSLLQPEGKRPLGIPRIRCEDSITA